MSRRRPKKKTTIKNKARFTIFCLVSIFLLAFIFIKFFMPHLNKNLSSEETNNGKTYIEASEETEKTINETTSEEVQIDKPQETETEDEAEVDLPGKKSEMLESNQGPYVYFRQTDPEWSTKTYGPRDPIGTHGCGPTVMASVVSSLSGKIIDPLEMSNWAYENGYHAPDAGSLHALIPEAAKAYGLKEEPLYYPSPQELEEALRESKYVVMVSGHGRFSSADGHFIVLIDIDDEGYISISDSLRYKHVGRKWTADEILNEASPVSAAGGPLWAIWK